MKAFSPLPRSIGWVHVGMTKGVEWSGLSRVEEVPDA